MCRASRSDAPTSIDLLFAGNLAAGLGDAEVLGRFPTDYRVATAGWGGMIALEYW